MKKDMKLLHTCNQNTSPTSLTMRNESHVISNFKPKIRIVHIFAPEIIKTDAANFRELVQRLTGKPVGRKARKKKVPKEVLQSECCRPKEVTESFNGRVKGEEMWGEENSSFFGGFGDLDCFIQGLTDFPLLPLNSSRLDVFGESRDVAFPV